ncbi:hypothetical protein niasHT_017355 [Heterodera trifolii]|uniref:Uncharacterized protein n=1 Tax=Heterodera trifolii TaxID=157864 RepID=A0ABD2L442_9BILA
MRHLYKKWPRSINDITNQIDLTALPTTAAADRHEIVKFLLENGANAAKITKKGNNSFEVAAGNASFSSLKILMGEYYVNNQFRLKNYWLLSSRLMMKRTTESKIRRLGRPRSITPTRRARVQAYLLDGMAVSDIARNLRMPPGTVRSIRLQMDK